LNDAALMECEARITLMAKDILDVTCRQIIDNGDLTTLLQ
jgi:hypothetical protein